MQKYLFHKSNAKKPQTQTDQHLSFEQAAHLRVNVLSADRNENGFKNTVFMIK